MIPQRGRQPHVVLLQFSFALNMFTTNQFSNLIQLSFSMSNRPSFEMIVLELEHTTTTCAVFCKYLLISYCVFFYIVGTYLIRYVLAQYVLSCSTTAYDQLYSTIPKSAKSLLHGGQLGLIIKQRYFLFIGQNRNSKILVWKLE